MAEACFAGALGVRLGGPTQYRHQLEIRPTLGDGAAPGPADLRRAVRLSRIVQIGALGTALVISAVGRARVISAVGRTGRRASVRV